MKQTLPLQDTPYVVAEIGCNHKGSIKIALRMIEEASNCGVHAVKFQKRSNKDLFSADLYNQSYNNRNSYGTTYGIHRESLELSTEEYLQIKKCADQNNVSLQVTPFDIPSLEFCENIGFDGYKIASADIQYPELIDAICKKGKPVFISTGGAILDEITQAINIIHTHNIPSIIYHCTAAYPAPVEDMNLAFLPTLISIFGQYSHIGLSDHENGIDAASVAYMLGARVFEKHFTLDRSWKGTDQSFSLEPSGLSRLVRNLKRIPIMLGSGEKTVFDSEHKPLAKMIKSACYSGNLQKDNVIKPNHFIYKVNLNPGVTQVYINNYIGKTLVKDVFLGQQFETSHVC